MLKLRVVQAANGDCLILENGSMRNGTFRPRRCVLIDGGPSGIYAAHLRGVLQEIAAAGGRISCMALTHVDNDHAIGLLDFSKELQRQRDAGQPPLISVDALWHNAFTAILPETMRGAARELEAEMLAIPFDGALTEKPAAVDRGFREGQQLLLAEVDLDIPRNEGFPGGLITTVTAPRAVTAAGVRIRILGPSQKRIDRLREKWEDWLSQPPPAPGRAKPPAPDSSETNLSSIMFLAEAGRPRRRILLTGDGLPSDLLAGLEEAGLLPPGGTMHVDIFKLLHHGSARNASQALFDRVVADTYVLCADGRNGNPDALTLEWLVDSACRRQKEAHIIATSPAPTITDLLAARPSASNFYRMTVMGEGQHSILI
jgi:hypothetical protein